MTTDILEHVTNEEKYRSQPRVDMADDMVRVTICIPINEWRAFKATQQKIKRILEAASNENASEQSAVKHEQSQPVMDTVAGMVANDKGHSCLFGCTPGKPHDDCLEHGPYASSGIKEPELPPTCWFTRIAGWHRVRTKIHNKKVGRKSGGEEIGAGNSKEAAAAEAWEWWRENIDKDSSGLPEPKNITPPPPMSPPKSPIVKALEMLEERVDRNADSDGGGWLEFEIEHQHLPTGDWRKEPEGQVVRIRQSRLAQPRPDLKRVKGELIDGRMVYHDIKGRLIEDGDRLNVYCREDGTAKLGVVIPSEDINMGEHGLVSGLTVRVHANPGFENWRMDAYPVEVRENNDA